MSVLVKICGLTHADDVKGAVKAGADAIGFVFFQGSARYVEPSAAAALSDNIPSGVKRVAVMLHPSAAEWQRVATAFAPDVLQTDSEDYAELDVDEAVECWPVFREGGRVPAQGRYVYEGRRSGVGKTVDWAHAADLSASGDMILAGGLGPENVADAVRVVRPFGVDASSSLETRPGRKDFQRMCDYVQAAKAA